MEKKSKAIERKERVENCRAGKRQREEDQKIGKRILMEEKERRRKG